MEKTPSRGNTVSELLAQMGPPPSEEDFDVDVSGVEAASTEPAWNFPPAPSRPTAAVAVAMAEPVAPALPGPSALAAELAAAAGGDASPVRPLPRAPGSGLANLFEDEPDASAPPPAAAESVASSDDLASLAGFTPAWGLAAPSRALSVDGTLSSHVSSLAAVAEPVPPPPRPQFGGAGTVLDDLPSLEPPGLPAHGELELDAGPGTPDWSEVSPTNLGGNQIELGPELPSMELDRRPPPELEPSPPPDLSWSPPAPAPPGPELSWSLSAPAPPAPASTPAPPLSWSLPEPAAAPAAAAASPGLAWDDPFSGPPPHPAPSTVPEPAAPMPHTTAPNAVVLDEAPAPGPGSPDHGFFDMLGGEPSGAPASGASGALLPDIPEAAEPPAAALSPTISGPLSPLSRPPGRMRLGLQERELPGTARRVSAVVLNVGLAALLLLVVVGLVSSWATAGRVDGSALSPRRLLQALRPGIGMTPVEVTPGTYETRSGRWLLYVRGRVMNRGAPPSRVRVRAEVWDGAQAVKTGETLAGAIATPEELWRAASPADVEALRARLVGAGTPVAAGQEADFLVLLDEAPRDLSGLRLKVTASVDR